MAKDIMARVLEALFMFLGVLGEWLKSTLNVFLEVFKGAFKR